MNGEDICLTLGYGAGIVVTAAVALAGAPQFALIGALVIGAALVLIAIASAFWGMVA